MEDCVFCKIINKTLPADRVYEDDDLIIFKDIHPKAKTHLLVVPKKHIDTVKDMKKADELLAGKIIMTARKIAEEKNLDGYQLLFNVGQSAGQIVFHVHLHLMSNN